MEPCAYFDETSQITLYCNNNNHMTRAKRATSSKNYISYSAFCKHSCKQWGFSDVWTTQCQMFEICRSFLFTLCDESFFIFKGSSISDLFFLCFLNLLQHM